MRNKRQQTKNINNIKATATQNLINKLVLKNLKGGIGCPPPIFNKSSRA